MPCCHHFISIVSYHGLTYWLFVWMMLLSFYPRGCPRPGPVSQESELCLLCLGVQPRALTFYHASLSLGPHVEVLVSSQGTVGSGLPRSPEQCLHGPLTWFQAQQPPQYHCAHPSLTGRKSRAHGKSKWHLLQVMTSWARAEGCQGDESSSSLWYGCLPTCIYF